MPAKRSAGGFKPVNQLKNFSDGLLDSTRLVVYLKDVEGRYLYVNRRYEQIAGVPRAALAGKRDHDFFPPEVADLFLEQDAQVIKARKSQEFEETIPMPGGVLSFITEKFPLFGPDGKVCAVGGFCTEITSQKRRADESLAEERERLAVTMRSISEGVIATDTGGAVTMMNAAAEALAGMKQGEALGRRIDSVLVPLSADKKGFFGGLAARAMEAKAETCAPAGVALLTRGGETRTVLPSAGAVKDRRGAVIGAVLSLRDITLSRKLEEEARRAAERVLDAREFEKKRLAANLHDASGSFQVGMSALLLLLERDIRAGSREEALKKVERAKDLLKRSGDAIKTACVETWPPAIEVSGLVPALRELVAGFTARSGIKARAKIDLPDNSPAPDSRLAMTLYRITQEILHALERYSGARNLELAIKAAKGRVTISARDDGRGFDPVRSRNAKFTLPLRMMAEETKAAGGIFEFESSPGKGAALRIDLPLSAVTEAI